LSNCYSFVIITNVSHTQVGGTVIKKYVVCQRFPQSFV